VTDEPLTFPADEFALVKRVWEEMTPGEIAEIREQFDAAMANPGPFRILPDDHWKDRAEEAEAKLARLRIMHHPWEIRDGDDGEGPLEYLVCRHCCAGDGAGQTEECATEHRHGEGTSICPTMAIISSEEKQGD